jgi:hypothetical protein
MKTKLLSLVLFTALLVVLPLINAALVDVSTPVDLSDAEPETYFEITVNEDLGALTLSDTVLTIYDDDNNPMTVTLDDSALSTTTGVKRVNASLDIDDDFEATIGEYVFPEVEVYAENATNASVNETYTVTLKYVKTFCEAGEQGDDLVLKVDVDNRDGDDDEWSPLDEIIIEVEVENDGNDRIRDVIVELGLFNADGEDVTGDLIDLDDEEIDLGRIDEDDEESAEFKFKVPADFEEAKYMLVIKAYSDHDDYGEEELCVSESDDFSDDYYFEVSGEKESDEEMHVIVTDIRYSPVPAECGDLVTVSADVYNVGDEDYPDQIMVTLINKELGLDLEKVLRGDFDQGDDDRVEFEFEVPTDVEAKIYTLEFRTYYDYNEKKDRYDIESEETFVAPFEVTGNCALPDEEVDSTTGARISAELDPETPEAVAGKEVALLVTLTNTGDTQTIYTLSVYGNSAWSSLVSIEPQTVVLSAGETREIGLVLGLDSDAVGEKEFTIKASYGDTATEQKVTLLVQEAEEVSEEVSAVLQHVKDNWFIYLIVVANIILIIAIIAVVRSILSPRHPAAL